MRRADLLEEPFVHHSDPRPHRHRLNLVVGHVDHGGLEAGVESQDLRACLHAQLGVKVAERLIHQEDGRFADDRAPEGDTLALAA